MSCWLLLGQAKKGASTLPKCYDVTQECAPSSYTHKVLEEQKKIGIPAGDAPASMLSLCMGLGSFLSFICHIEAN
jgi:hypothetical protein